MEAPSDSFSGLHASSRSHGGDGDHNGNGADRPPPKRKPSSTGDATTATTTAPKKDDVVKPVALNPRSTFAIRSRADSSGSTRGAFGPALKPLNDGNPPPAPPPSQPSELAKSSPTHRHSRKSKHHHHHNNNNNNKSSATTTATFASEKAPPKNGNSHNRKHREGDGAARDGPPAPSASLSSSATPMRASAVLGLSSAAQQEWIRGGMATASGGTDGAGFDQSRMGQPQPPPPPPPSASRSNGTPPTSILKRGGKKNRPNDNNSNNSAHLYGMSLLETATAVPPLSGAEAAIHNRTKKNGNRPQASHTPVFPHPFAIREAGHDFDEDEDEDDGHDDYFRVGTSSVSRLQNPTPQSSSANSNAIPALKQPTPYSSRGEGRKSSGSANDPLRGSDILDKLDYDDQDEDDLEGGAILTSDHSPEAPQQLPLLPSSAALETHPAYGAVGNQTKDSGNRQNEIAMFAALAMGDSQMPPGPAYPQQHHPLLSPPLQQQQQQQQQYSQSARALPMYHTPDQAEPSPGYSEDGISSQEAPSTDGKARAKSASGSYLGRVSSYLHPAHLFGMPPPAEALTPSSLGEYSLDEDEVLASDGYEGAHGNVSRSKGGDGGPDSHAPTGADWYYTAGGGRLIRQSLNKLLYDPEINEFTSLQQFSWAVLLGIVMGVFTAKWGQFIGYCVDKVWVDIPETLLEWGVFTDLDGSFPLPHYMWICPAVMGGILSCITVLLPKVPGQNEWIESLHRVGLMDHSTFWTIIALSTAGMASGLSLGPELPLVLTSGMVGSYLALVTHQSILSARVMNLTAASAAIGGFFGFPMAGALFVLEIPHRMGLQYFEALSPATIASIVAVLTNRMVTGNDLKGYFNYPFLTSTLPSHIFYAAVIYGLVGSVIGVAYAEGCKKLKVWVHDWFHPHDDHHDGHGDDEHHHDHNDEKDNDDGHNKTGTSGHDEEKSVPEETVPLVDHHRKGPHPTPPPPNAPPQRRGCYERLAKALEISNEPLRAGLIGVIAGLLNGLICMFVPHNLFWGEDQIQTLIDRGLTPLPVFGHGDEPTADMMAYGFCVIDYSDEVSMARGITTECLALIAGTKVLTVGLSLGTGIVGGHFWGPLFVGAACAHLFTDLMSLVSRYAGVGVGDLTTYPCVALLCIMGSAHVVTFRAHTAIMLILTLTISAFSPEEGAGSGKDQSSDYSAVFPLLVVSCFVSLMVTRSTVFYKEQRCRGDILASPQVLCEPRKQDEADHAIIDAAYDENDDDEYDEQDEDDDDDLFDSSDWDDPMDSKSEETSSFGSQSGGGGAEESSPVRDGAPAKTVETETTQKDIEVEFEERSSQIRSATPPTRDKATPQERLVGGIMVENRLETLSSGGETSVTDPSAGEAGTARTVSMLPSKRLDELLATVTLPQRLPPPKGGSKRGHRRHKSTSDALVKSQGVVAPPVSNQKNRRRNHSGDPIPTLSHRRTASVEAVPKGHRRTASVEAVPKGHRRTASVEAVPKGHRRTASVEAVPKGHRRTASVEAVSYFRGRADSGGHTPRSLTPTKGVLHHHRRGKSYGGEIDFQPALLEQARARASSSASNRQQQHTLFAATTSVTTVLPKPRHKRSHSSASAVALTSVGLTPHESSGALSQDDLERSFSAVVNQMALRRGGNVRFTS